MLESKGYQMPINSTAVLLLTVIFIALFFALVSGVVSDEVDKLLEFSDENTPETETSSDLEESSHTPKRYIIKPVEEDTAVMT